MIYNTQDSRIEGMREQHFATNIIKKSVIAVNVNTQASSTDGVATWFEHRLISEPQDLVKCSTMRYVQSTRDIL